MPNAVALKVLVVDDQNSVRQMTRMTLEEIGIRHIHEAENGVQAMETASLQPIDLIISDYNMPEMDGLGLLRAVRGHPVVRRVPFILLTGRGDKELVVKAAQAGANNYLIKPFTTAILRSKSSAPSTTTSSRSPSDRGRSTACDRRRSLAKEGQG